MFDGEAFRGRKLSFGTAGFMVTAILLVVGTCAPACRADSISTVDVHCSSCVSQTGIAIVTTANGVTYSVLDNLGGLTGMCDSFCKPGTTDSQGNPYEANLLFGSTYGNTSISVQASSDPIILPSLGVGQSVVDTFPVIWSGFLDQSFPGGDLFLKASGTGTATFTFVGVLGGPLDGPMTSVRNADYELVANPEPASLSLMGTGVILIIALYHHRRKTSPARTFSRVA